MKLLKLAFALTLIIGLPIRANADMFGGDVAVLLQIYANALEQLIQLKQVLTTGQDTLDLMRDINRGIRDGLSVIRIVNPKFNPGIFGSLDSSDRVLSALQGLYGRVPQSSESSVQLAQDQLAAESIAMNGTLFRFADSADEESHRIVEHAAQTNPEGTAKLTAQSIAVLIGVTTQLLRTNSMMLKLMGQNLAGTNRREKLETEQFKAQFDGISNGLKTNSDQTHLGSLNGG